MPATVDSVDASAYEQATLLHDMNLPWAEGQPGLGSYDAVLDFGCLEHVFDFPVAWRNCVALCRVGGHLFHSLPANNLSGHGFYQFSPELFFNLYQAKNGFELLGIWFALKADPRYWWQVADPAAVRHRVTLRNAHEVYMLVLAKKLAEVGPLPPPQQSDYAQSEWLKARRAGRAVERRRPQRRRRGLLAALGLLDAARLRPRAPACPARERPGAARRPTTERVDVAELLRRPAHDERMHDDAADPRPAAVREPGAARRRRALRLRARRCARRPRHEGDARQRRHAARAAGLSGRPGVERGRFGSAAAGPPAARPGSAGCRRSWASAGAPAAPSAA